MMVPENSVAVADNDGSAVQKQEHLHDTTQFIRLQSERTQHVEARPPTKMKPRSNADGVLGASKTAIRPAREDECHYYVARKRRYCNLTVAPGRSFCGQHLHLDSGAMNDGRIFCPYDKGHTVRVAELPRHLKRCNARPVAREPWCVPDCNIIRPTIDPVKRISPKEFPQDEFNSMCKWVHEEFERLFANEPIITQILHHDALRAKIDLRTKANNAAQQASLVSHMEKLGVFNGRSTFVEFGAGKGELTRWVWTATSKELEVESPIDLSLKNQTAPHRFVLVDRANFRKKFDFYVTHGVTDMSEKKSSGPDRREAAKIDRLTADVKDLDMFQIPDIENEKVVGIAKHLCGSATDLSLKALESFMKRGGNVQAIVMALCCHHVCNFNSCISESITQRQHQFLISIAAWATCAWNSGKEKDTEVDNDDDHQHGITDVHHNDTIDDIHWSGMSQEQREDLGYKAKRILDAGRRDFVKALGFETKLVYFVEKAISLENVALIATKT